MPSCSHIAWKSRPSDISDTENSAQKEAEQVCYTEPSSISYTVFFHVCVTSACISAIKFCFRLASEGM